jgi:hypothetical protein
MIIKSSTPRKRRTALACAAALAGVTAVMGVGAAPVAARPDYGAVTVDSKAAPTIQPCGDADPVMRPKPHPSAESTRGGDAHVDGGRLLR